ncbi:MAG: hypothetical protein AAGJ34_12885 [Pseudomonadota bacterium]
MTQEICEDARSPEDKLLSIISIAWAGIGASNSLEKAPDPELMYGLLFQEIAILANGMIEQIELLAGEAEPSPKPTNSH